MPTVDKRITELTEASSVDLTMDYLAIDNVRDGTRKCKPLDIGAKYSLEQDETDGHVVYFTGTDGTDVTITTTDTIYSITQSGHSFTLVGSNGYRYTVAIPYDSVSMTQAEYDALTPVQKADGTARFITDAISTEESELWSRVGRGTLHTDAQVISNAVNELKDVIGSGDLDTTSQELIGAVNELNSSLNDLFLIRRYSYDYTVASYTGITITKVNLGITPISGYSIGALNFYAVGANAIVPRTINYAGNDIVRLYNPTNNSISSTFTISVLWIKSSSIGD